MGDLSLHFSRWEYKCKCGKCEQNAVDVELNKVMERLRVHCETERKDSFISITSGNRCVKYNEEVQKRVNPKYIPNSSRSKHLFSIANDFQVKGWSPTEIYDILDKWYPDKYGLKEYSSWVHFDVRKRKWRGKRP